MIKHLYIDNYKCFVNFEFTPGSTVLILGMNGTGKSSFFDVLALLQDFLGGTSVEALFPQTSLTRWDTRTTQTFRLKVSGGDSEYLYSLTILHSKDGTMRRMQEERLSFSGNDLFVFENGNVQLYRDDFSTGPSYPADWSRSALGAVPSGRDNAKLTWFKEHIERTLLCQINPWEISARCEKEEQIPARDMSNFSAWYRSLTQEMPEVIAPLFAELKQIIPDFHSLRLKGSADESRLLQVSLESKNDAPPYSYSFAELSDGQRVLVVLYTILFSLVRRDSTICIDEPGNFLALREIQPWVSLLREKSSECGSQLLMVSHHPELIDYLAVDCGVTFVREASGPVRVETFQNGTGLDASEAIARGWDGSDDQ